MIRIILITLMLLSLFGCSHKESSVVKIYEMSGDTWKTRGSALGNRAQGQAAGNEAQGDYIRFQSYGGKSGISLTEW